MRRKRDVFEPSQSTLRQLANLMPQGEHARDIVESDLGAFAHAMADGGLLDEEAENDVRSFGLGFDPFDGDEP